MSPQVWPAPAEDTGWIPVTLAAPWTAFGNGVAYRRKNGMVTVAIDAQHASSYSSQTAVFTLPAGFRPARRVLFPHFYGGLALGQVSSAGVVSVGEAATAALNYAFAVVTFPV